jgi:DNA-binding MarR family transcriptional regulator
LTDRPLTDRLETWTSLVAVYQTVLHDVVDALENEAGLDSGVYSALAYLDLAGPPGRLRMSALTRLMHPRYSQPGLSRLVQRMEADGLVRREPDPSDGRAVVLVMTPSGRSRYRRAHEVYDAALEKHFAAHLTDEESARLSDALRQFMVRRSAR